MRFGRNVSFLEVKTLEEYCIKCKDIKEWSYIGVYYCSVKKKEYDMYNCKECKTTHSFEIR